MFPYKTNSADYLDYVASAMSREEILADPKFCSLLENPYIKDNMEVALAWHAAKFGDYQDKYNFVEYYLCNGPELDADTLLHYRALAQADPVIMEIAFSYFDDPVVLSEIRETKYGKKKKNDWTDCFTNPCNYLGDFSGVMGSMGDSPNYDTYFNIIGERFQHWWHDEDKHLEGIQTLMTQMGGDPPQKQGSSASGAKGISGQVIQPRQPNNDSNGASPGSAHLKSKMRPNHVKGWHELGCLIFENDKQFADELQKKYTNSIIHIPKFGDAFCGAFGDAIALVDKANVARMLGDCQRMWSQVRRLRIFGSDNQYSPITSDQLVPSKLPDGTPSKPLANPHPTPNQSTAGISAGQAAMEKVRDQKNKEK